MNKGKVRLPTPEVFPSGDGQWCWRVRNGWNKQIICIGGETFSRKGSAASAYRKAFGISKDAGVLGVVNHSDIEYTAE